MDLLLIRQGGNDYGVMLYDDADPERNPGAQYMYDAAGFENLSPQGMADAMEMTKDERDKVAGVCEYKKARFWFEFATPQPYLELRDIQDVFATEFQSDGWEIRRSIGHITGEDLNIEEGEVLGDWEVTGAEPPKHILSRLWAKSFTIIVSKPSQLPYFSDSEKYALTEQCKSIAASIY